MRYKLFSVKNFLFEDEPNAKGFIGGTIIASNLDTGEDVDKRVYKRFHNGRTNKFDVVGQMVKELVPPDEPEETENSDENSESIDS